MRQLRQRKIPERRRVPRMLGPLRDRSVPERRVLGERRPGVLGLRRELRDLLGARRDAVHELRVGKVPEQWRVRPLLGCLRGRAVPGRGLHHDGGSRLLGLHGDRAVQLGADVHLGVRLAVRNVRRRQLPDRWHG